jgi:hypothetical protein
VGTQEVGVRAHISCSIWRCPRTPGAFYLQARPATHLATRYHVGADEVGEVRGRSPPAFHANCMARPSIVRHQPLSFSAATPAETAGAAPVMRDSEHPNFSTDLWKFG